MSLRYNLFSILTLKDKYKKKHKEDLQALKISAQNTINEYQEGLEKNEDSIEEKSPEENQDLEKELESYFQRESYKLLSKN